MTVIFTIAAFHMNSYLKVPVACIVIVAHSTLHVPGLTLYADNNLELVDILATY